MLIAYGPHQDNVIDLTMPPGRRPTALVVVLHGGYWRQRVGFDHIAPAAAALAARGHAVANVEYRRVGGGGGWPMALLDIAAAADAVGHLVPQVVYLGHSVGGYLALWNALRDRLPPGAPGWSPRRPAVSRIVAVAPVSRLVDAYSVSGSGEGAVRDFMGGAPEDLPERYASCDPGSLGAPGVPVTVVHGDADANVPIEMSRVYARDTGCRLVELAGVDHFQPVTPGHPAWEAVLGEVGP